MTTTRQDDWDEHLPYLFRAYRTIHHRVTTCSPALLRYGRELWAPADLLCGPLPEHPHEPSREGHARPLEEGLERVHAFVRRQLHMAGVKMKRRYDHRSQASKYTPGMESRSFNPRRRKGKYPKLTSPWQGPGVVLA